jgi:ferredoxin
MTNVAHVITEPCIDLLDRACIEECPVDCIYQGKRMSYINPEECTDCGACEPVCPVEAIYYEDDVPEDQVRFIFANAEFAKMLPGTGASRVGPLDYDAPSMMIEPSDQPPVIGPPVGKTSIPQFATPNTATAASDQRIALLSLSNRAAADQLKLLLLFFDTVAVLAVEDASKPGGPAGLVDLVGALEVDHVIPDVTDDVVARIVEWEQPGQNSCPRGDIAQTALRARYFRERAGASEYDVLRGWAGRDADLTSAIVGQAMSIAARQRGVVLEPTTFSILDAYVLRRATAGIGAPPRWNFFDPVGVAPDLSLAPIDEFLAFRREYGPLFRNYARMAKRHISHAMAAASDHDAGWRWADGLDEMEEHARELRRLGRASFHSPPVWDLGIAGCHVASKQGDRSAGQVLFAVGDVNDNGRDVYTYVFQQRPRLTNA